MAHDSNNKLDNLEWVNGSEKENIQRDFFLIILSRSNKCYVFSKKAISNLINYANQNFAYFLIIVIGQGYKI